MAMKPEPKKINNVKRMSPAKIRSVRAQRNGVEGPKRSVGQPTAANRASAAKRSSVKRSSAEGPKRSVKMSPTAMAYAKRNPRIVESGVGNIPMTIARAGKAAVDFFKGPAVRVAPKPSSFKTTTSGVSKKTGGVMKNGKPVKYGPAKKTLTPGQKGAQTRLTNRARATYAAEGPKKSVASPKKPTTKSNFPRAQVMATGVVGGGALAAGIGAAKRNNSPKSNSLPKGASMGKMVWNGSTWVKKK